MAMAVQRVHPGAQCTIGPWIERGFYYDFDMPAPIADKDLPKIRKEMLRIIKSDLPFVREEVGGWVWWCVGGGWGGRVCVWRLGWV